MYLSDTHPFSPYGTHPVSPDDERDYPFATLASRLGVPSTSALPDEIGQNWVDNYPGIRDQSQEGTCTGHGMRSVKQTTERAERKTKKAKQNVPEFGPRGIYEWAKQQGGYPGEEGAYLRDVLVAAAKRGVPLEKDWPYIADRPDNPNYAQKIGQPDATIDKGAKRWQIGSYYRAKNIPEMLQGLLVSPLYIAIDVYDGFERVGLDGIVPMPKASEKSLGGHCVAVLLAKQSTRRFYVPNQWGTDWGHNGFCWLPFEYVTEAWVIHEDARK